MSVNGSIHVAVQFPEYVQMTGSWHAKRFIGCWVCYTLRVIYPERIRKIFLKRFVLNLKRFQLLNQRVLGFILKAITGNATTAWLNGFRYCEIFKTKLTVGLN